MFYDTQEQIELPSDAHVNSLDKKFPREPIKNEFSTKTVLFTAFKWPISGNFRTF